MQWTMPPRLLQIVASLIALAAAASFVLGVLNAPQRSGRLPGEKLAGASGSAAPIDATDATPLSNERIEGPPQPTPQELAAKAKADAEAKAKAAEDADEADQGNLATAAPVLTLPRAAPSPNGAAGQPGQTLGGPPASDEPPH